MKKLYIAVAILIAVAVTESCRKQTVENSIGAVSVVK